MIEVYVHTSPSGKQYAGISTRGAAARWKNHVQAARRGSGLLFHRAIRKYGPDAFTSEVLASCLDLSAAKVVERAVIHDLSTLTPAGYNLTRGGEGTLGRVKRLSERLAISRSKVGKKASDDTRAKQSVSHRGRKHSAETKRKIGEANRRRVWTPEMCAKQRDLKLGNKNCAGRSISEETRAKISAANSGRCHSPEARQKMSESRRGCKRGPMSAAQKAKLSACVVSEETRARMSAAQQARRARNRQETAQV